MIGQKHCPYCQTPAILKCPHLALTVEGREFVRRCVELCKGEAPWRAICERRRAQMPRPGERAPPRADFTLPEAAFSQGFLARLRCVGGMDNGWAVRARPARAGAS